jgi:hypothetical protein
LSSIRKMLYDELITLIRGVQWMLALVIIMKRC